MADRLMLLDTASLYFRAFYGLPDSIRRSDDTPVNAVRGLLDMIGRLSTDYEATHVIACWDDAWRPRWRVDLVPSYKEQRLDDERHVRVIYTARGMKNLDVLTEKSVVAKYRVLPEQYADFATLRGDASDGLPGVAGIGEKTAASLLGEYGTLDALREAADDDDADLSASVRGKLLAASDYLDAAPTVVRVVRDLDVPAPDAVGARLRPVTGADRDRLEELREEWNLGGAVTRLLAALDAHG